MIQRTIKTAVTLGVLLCVVFVLCGSGAWAQSKTADKPESSQAVSFAVSPALTDIAPEIIQQALQAPGEEAEIEGGIRNPRLPWALPANDLSQDASGGKTSAASVADGALQTQAPSQNIPAPALTFDGVLQSDNASAGFGALTPPDTDGDVGPNHYVQQVNLLYKIFNKSGTLVAGPFKLSSLWVAAGKADQCAAADQGDPIVLYDSVADRWILSQFAFASQTAAPYFECIAVSKTGDPTGAYYLYTFKTGAVSGANEFPDYPKIGVWPDGYYMMVHQFTLGGNFNGSGYYAFDRKKMLVGDPNAGYIYFNLNLTAHPEGVGGSLPASVDGLRMPAPGSPGIFSYFTATVWGDPANGLRLFQFHADYTTPANSTLTELTSYQNPLAVAAFDVTTPTGNNGRRAVPQPGVTVTAALDAITDRLMHRLQYRNFGSYETLVTNHTVGAPASTTFGTFRAAPRYYELRRTLPGGSWVVQEQATYAPADGLSRWMGSAAEDNQGNLAVGFSRSGASAPNYPSLAYAGRLAGDAPGGLQQGENTLFAGAGSQSSTANRWGDYSALALDPTDDCTFWYTNEYYSSTSSANWRTRIGNFKFDGCTAPARGTLSGTITNCITGLPVAGAMVQVSDGHSATTNASGAYSVGLTPAAYSAFASATGYANSASSPFTITDGNTSTVNACISGAPIISTTAQSITGGDGSGTLKPNDCKQISVTLMNNGGAPLTGATATLTTTTPGINISQPTSAYPTINPATSAANSTPFSVTTDASLVCGTTATFNLKINSAQGFFNTSFTTKTCQAPAITFTGTITTSSPNQTGRLVRNGVAGTCGTTKAYPGLNDSTLRHYAAFGPFTNTDSNPNCVTVSVVPACTATNIFASSYSPSFNPANIAQNYLSDAGSSTNPETWSFMVPAGQSFYVDVNGVSGATTVCNEGFTGTITGLLSSSGGAGACSVGVVSGTVNLITTATLSKNSDGTYKAIVTVTNNGTGTAQGVKLTGAMLGTASGSSLPINLGTIAPSGGSAVTSVTFPASAGASGTALIEKYAGSYTGGSFTGSIRATLP